MLWKSFAVQNLSRRRRCLAGNLLPNRRSSARSHTGVCSLAAALIWRRPCLTIHPPVGSVPWLVLGGSALTGCRPLQGLRPRTPSGAVCGRSVCKRAGNLQGFCLVRLLRAVALDGGWHPHAPGCAVCKGYVWFGSGGLSPLTGATPPYPSGADCVGSVCKPSPCAQRSEGAVTPQPAERAGFTPRSYFRSDIRKRS